MVAGDLIRLAWEADHDGRPRLREAALTLAIAESFPGDSWAERCKDRLVSDRPEHFFGQFASIAEALEDARVIEARHRLRIKYPHARVQSLLLRARATRGPFLGRVESVEAMIDDLSGPLAESDNVRRDVAQASRGPISLQRSYRPLALALAYPSMTSGLEEPSRRPRQRTFPQWAESVAEPPIEDFPTYYLTVLLALAFLLATVQPPSDVSSPGG